MKKLTEVSHFDENPNHSYGWKDHFNYLEGRLTSSMKLDTGHWKKKYSTKDYDLYHHNDGGTHRYVAVDKNNKPILGVGMAHTPGKFGVIDTLASNKANKSNTVKAHHLYHDLMHHGIVKGLVTDNQSTGGMKVWQKLNKLRNINIHGWDDDEEKPINLGRVFRPDETHIHSDEYNKKFQAYRKDREEVSKKLYDHPASDDPIKKKLADDLLNVDADHYDLKKQRNMKLVAHLKKKALHEVRALPNVDKYEKFGWQTSFDRYGQTGMKDKERGNWKVKHEGENYTLLHRKRKDFGYTGYHEFMAVDKNNKPIVGVNGSVTKGKFLQISTLASNAANRDHPVKAHHFYHDLMHHGHVKGFVTSSQSEGGMKVWQKLNRIRGINIHGWDDEEKMPVNLGRVFRPDETHKTGDEHGRDWDRHYWDTDDMSKNDPERRKFVDDIEDKEKDFRMKLVAHLKGKKKKKLNEDAPTNSAGAGAVAGLGIGPQGDAVGGRPFKRGQFGKYSTFIVSPHTYLKARTEKKKGAHWRKYLEEDENYNDIREYAFKKPKSPIILQCERTGAMCFARYGIGT